MMVPRRSSSEATSFPSTSGLMMTEGRQVSTTLTGSSPSPLASRTKSPTKSRPPRTMPRSWSDKLPWSVTLTTGGEEGAHHHHRHSPNNNNNNNRHHHAKSKSHHHHRHSSHHHHSKKKHAHHHHSHNKSAGGDDYSDSTNSAPSSVLVSSSPSLARDLSDLSGSYKGGTTTPPRGRSSESQQPSQNNHHHPSGGGGGRYASDQSATSYQRPWRQALSLSSRPPNHPQPALECDDSSSSSFRPKGIMLQAEEDGVIELVKESSIFPRVLRAPAVTLSTTPPLDKRRIPLIILLMDPQRKLYELMQLWVDVQEDTVRDVLHSVQRHVNATDWKQDYDGLFFVRKQPNPTSTTRPVSSSSSQPLSSSQYPPPFLFHQCIHILNVSKYEIQPYECWIAKPWSMAAKSTMTYATSILQHLHQCEIITPVTTAATATSNSTITHPLWKRSMPPNAASGNKPEEVSWVLSGMARSRIYVPEGILRHHHACQYLAFSPPLEPMVRVDVLSGNHHNNNNDDTSSLQSFTSSLASGGSEDRIVGGPASMPSLPPPPPTLRPTWSAGREPPVPRGNSTLSSSSSSQTLRPESVRWGETHVVETRQAAAGTTSSPAASRPPHPHKNQRQPPTSPSTKSASSNNTSSYQNNNNTMMMNMNHPSKKTRPGGGGPRGLSKALAALSCSSCRKEHHALVDDVDSRSGMGWRDVSETMLDYTEVGLMPLVEEEQPPPRPPSGPEALQPARPSSSWRIVEEEASIVSESAPLLFVRHSPWDWNG